MCYQFLCIVHEKGDLVNLSHNWLFYFVEPVYCDYEEFKDMEKLAFPTDNDNDTCIYLSGDPKLLYLGRTMEGEITMKLTVDGIPERVLQAGLDVVMPTPICYRDADKYQYKFTVCEPYAVDDAIITVCTCKMEHCAIYVKIPYIGVSLCEAYTW